MTIESKVKTHWPPDAVIHESYQIKHRLESGDKNIFFFVKTVKVLSNNGKVIHSSYTSEYTSDQFFPIAMLAYQVSLDPNVIKIVDFSEKNSDNDGLPRYYYELASFIRDHYTEEYIFVFAPQSRENTPAGNLHYYVWHPPTMKYANVLSIFDCALFVYQVAISIQEEDFLGIGVQSHDISRDIPQPLRNEGFIRQWRLTDSDIEDFQKGINIVHEYPREMFNTAPNTHVDLPAWKEEDLPITITLKDLPAFSQSELNSLTHPINRPQASLETIEHRAYDQEIEDALQQIYHEELSCTAENTDTDDVKKASNG